MRSGSLDDQRRRDAQGGARLLQVPGKPSYPPKGRTAVIHGNDSSRLNARYLASA